MIQVIHNFFNRYVQCQLQKTHVPTYENADEIAATVSSTEGQIWLVPDPLISSIQTGRPDAFSPRTSSYTAIRLGWIVMKLSTCTSWFIEPNDILL